MIRPDCFDRVLRQLRKLGIRRILNDGQSAMPLVSMSPLNPRPECRS
jgi:hypothetical protein